MKNYQKISRLLLALENCEKNNNQEFLDKHKTVLDKIVDNGPSGSGIDNGIKLLWEESNPDKLVFQADFHHMNDAGYYDGWSHHKVIVKPSFAFDLDIRITGRDRRHIKEYLSETFSYWLEQEYNPILEKGIYS